MYNDLYANRKKWNKLLLLIAVTIVIFSLVYTYKLYQNLQIQEKSKVEDIARAYSILLTSEDQLLLDQALEIIKGNNYIPIVWANDKNDVLGTKNIDSTQLDNKSLLKQIEKSKLKNHIVVVPSEDKQYIYYSDSKTLEKLKLFPIIQILLISIFLFLGYWTFRSAQIAEQNQLWVGMAKETAHQLGTPISSLSAWIEVLKDKLSVEDLYISDELSKDFNRLEIVADRFSKIGSTPALQEENILFIIHEMMDYFSKRAAKNIQFSLIDNTNGLAKVNINKSLIEWVFENIFKNALDSMEGVGTVSISVNATISAVTIDIADTGKGIPKTKWLNIFEPGFSTKKRGWGLGLTLTKRIVEQYHKGKIFVLKSELNKGTTFRIVFNH